jgi:hypothetical protein
MKNNYARKVALGHSTYSEVEWTKINHEVKAVAKRGLSSREREFLEVAAWFYQQATETMSGPGFRPRKKRAQAWQKVSRLARDLVRSITIAQTASLEPPDRFFLERYYARGEFFLESYHGREEGDGAQPGRSLSDLLAQCERHAAENARSSTRAPSSDIHDERERDLPRMRYYRDLLELWTAIGGRLAVSRDPNTQLLGGPTIRFILAVTGPVMGAAAPKREAIKAIITREKKRRNGYTPRLYWKRRRARPGLTQIVK